MCETAKLTPLIYFTLYTVRAFLREHSCFSVIKKPDIILMLFYNTVHNYIKSYQILLLIPVDVLSFTN